MGLIIPSLNNGYTEFGGGYFRDSGGNVNKIGGMYYSDGKGNVTKIYNYSLPIGESLYNGIPSKGIMLYGDYTGYSSSNPLGIQGNLINLNAPLSSCPNGIKIHFSNISYQVNGRLEYSECDIPDISIPKRSSSGSSNVTAQISRGSIKASINGSALSFYDYNAYANSTYTGTVVDVGNDGYGNQQPNEVLAILSITAY